MSEAIVRIKRDVVINILGMQARYTLGQIVGMRRVQADMLIGLGDAEEYKAEYGPSANKMELGAEEVKEVFVEVNRDAADYAESKGIDLEQVVGTGKEGRITLKDVKAFEKASGG